MNVRNSDKDALVGYNNFVFNHVHVIVYIKFRLLLVWIDFYIHMLYNLIYCTYTCTYQLMNEFLKVYLHLIK